MNDADAENEADTEEPEEIPATNFTAKAVPPPPSTHLVFDTKVAGTTLAIEEISDTERPPTPPTPLEEKDVVDLNFYAVLEGKR